MTIRSILALVAARNYDGSGGPIYLAENCTA